MKNQTNANLIVTLPFIVPVAGYLVGAPAAYGFSAAALGIVPILSFWGSAMMSPKPLVEGAVPNYQQQAPEGSAIATTFASIEIACLMVAFYFGMTAGIITRVVGLLVQLMIIGRLHNLQNQHDQNEIERINQSTQSDEYRTENSSSDNFRPIRNTPADSPLRVSRTLRQRRPFN